MAIHIVGRLGLFGVYRVLLQYSCLLVGLRNLYNPFLDIIKNLVNIAQYYFFPIFFLCISKGGEAFECFQKALPGIFKQFFGNYKQYTRESTLCDFENFQPSYIKHFFEIFLYVLWNGASPLRNESIPVGPPHPVPSIGW